MFADLISLVEVRVLKVIPVWVDVPATTKDPATVDNPVCKLTPAELIENGASDGPTARDEVPRSAIDPVPKYPW